MVKANVTEVTIFYFSGTGNTWWVSEEIARQFTERKVNATAYSIESLATEEAARLIEQSALVGIGYPIHGSDLPKPMKNFIEALPKLEGKKTFVFCSQWLWSGDGAAIGASLLEGKGYNVNWGEHFLMPNNVSVSIISLPYTNDLNRLNTVRGKARARIIPFVNRILSGTPYLHGFSTVSYLLGSIQRVPYRNFYHKLQNDIDIDRDNCIDCGVCVSLCPVGNLYSSGNDIKVRGNCILCLRCYNFCPVAAITYMGRPHLHRRGKPYKGPVEDFDPTVLVKKASIHS